MMMGSFTEALISRVQELVGSLPVDLTYRTSLPVTEQEKILEFLAAGEYGQVSITFVKPSSPNQDTLSLALIIDNKRCECLVFWRRNP